MSIGFVVEWLVSTFNVLPMYLLAALGGYLSQRVGILDLSMEGNMTLGCVLGILGFVYTGSTWGGLVFGCLGGIFIGLILALLTIRLNLDQIIIGFGLWFAGYGLSALLYQFYVLNETAEAFPSIAELLGVSTDIPVLGHLLSLNPVVYLSLVSVFAIAWFIYRTTPGLHIRATGEDPAVVDAAGISVTAVRFRTVLVGTALVGGAGAYLSIDVVQAFQQYMVSGRGWIALAIVIFGRWKPSNIFLGCLLFAGISGLQVRLQTIGVSVSPSLLNSLPFLATIIVLTVVMWLTKTTGMPAALGKPYFRE